MGDHEGDADPADLAAGVAARFSRDVMVNVVGNLLTVAVVYLVGAAADVLPRNAALTLASSLGLMIAFGPQITKFLVNRGVGDRTAVWGYAVVVIALLGTMQWIDTHSVLGLLGSALAMLASAALIRLIARRRLRASRR